MSNTYRIHGARYLRKYTAAEKSSAYSYMADVRKIANSLCAVPWSRVAMDIPATNTIHTEEGLDWNEPERDRFDAAEWCGEHSDGFHRAFAQAACYVFKLPTTAIGKTIQKIGVNVTSDPYNPYGARIAALTSATLNIPMDCDTVRTGDVFRAPDSDGLGAAPRLFRNNADGTQTWYSNSEIVELVPGSTLAAKQYLFVFVCLENYNRGRDGWIEGSSYIDNDIALTLSSAASDLDANELNDLTPPVVLSEFNVCRGEVVPRLIGNVSGVQAVEVSVGGDTDFQDVEVSDSPVSADRQCVGLRTAYGMLYTGQMNQIGAEEYGLKGGARPGAAFALSSMYANGVTGNSPRIAWTQANGILIFFCSVAYGDGVFVAATIDRGLYYSEDKGKTWTQSAQRTGRYESVSYGNGTFVASSSDAGLIYSTNGGRTWQNSNKQSGGWNGVCFGGGVFIAAGDSLVKGLWYSDDGGRTWIASGNTTGKFRDIAYSNGVFVAVGYEQVGSYVSADGGRTWSKSTYLPNDTWDGIASGNGVFVAYNSTKNSLYYSVDGLSWTVSNQVSGVWSSIGYGNGVFLASRARDGSSARDEVIYSVDNGATWVHGGSDNMNVQCFAYGDGVFILSYYSASGGVYYADASFVSKMWKIVTSVMFLRFAVPIDFKATKVRLDWNGWNGTATAGSKFNVWMKRGEFAAEYPESVVKNHAIYDCEAVNVDGYELIGVVDAAASSRTATLDLKRPLDGQVATILLSAFVSMDRSNPSSSLNLPQGAATAVAVDLVNKRVSNLSACWRPDITLLG